MQLSRTYPLIARLIHSGPILRTVTKENPYDHMEIYGNLSRPCTLRFDPVVNNGRVQQLIQKSKGPWTDMTIDEKIELYRAMFPYSMSDIQRDGGKTWEIIWKSAIIICIGIGTFFVARFFIDRVSEPKITRTKEWKEAARKKSRENLADPIFGVSSKKE